MPTSTSGPASRASSPSPLSPRPRSPSSSGRRPSSPTGPRSPGPASSTSSPPPSPPPPTATPSTTYPLPPPPPPRDSPAYLHARDLTHYLEATFVPSVVPQPDEYQAKELARQYLEQLAAQVSPGAKLLPFGSMANGFALKNSDMDLCCFLAKDAPVRAPAELVELLGRLIEQETNFYVKMLPRARIPIIKLTMPASPACPAGVACDIGFENRLALENTRLLLTYAMVDSRLRTLVLFLKVWTKRRKINNPYRGTLSSYGYVLLVIHFLAHVKQPPVLPNLQRLPLPDATPLDDLTFDGHDIGFFDDVDALPSVFETSNTDTAGELLIDFFRYWSKEFNYAHQVVSIRSEKGTVQKVAKGWHTDFEFDPELIVRDQHKLCIEDPFQLDYNVARTVTRDGLYTIRGEFMRAFRILTTPPRAATSTSAEENVGTLIGALCDEREDYLLIHPADAAAADLHPAQAYGYGRHYGAPQHHLHGPYAPPHPPQGGPPGSPSPSSASTAMPSSSTPTAGAGPKSPRRRSAPSPGLAAEQASPHQHHPQHAHQHPHQPQHSHPSQQTLHPHSYHPQQQQQQQQQAQHPPPLWAAANGATVYLSSAPAAAPARGKERTVSAGGVGANAGRDEGKEGAQPKQQSRGPPGMLGEAFAPFGSATAASASASAAAAAAPGGAGGAHERRSSWNGAPAREGDAPLARAALGSADQQSGAGVDLHRFFQGGVESGGGAASSSSSSGPAISSSQSDAGGPTASSSSFTFSSGAAGASTAHGHALPPPRTAVSLTAPSSPDLAASSAYFAGHPPALSSAYGPSGAYGRGYGAGAGGARAFGGPHVGPRLQSLPRQLNGHQRQQHHARSQQQHHDHGPQAQQAASAYPNPYAAPPTPLPFSATAPPNPPPLGGIASLGLGFNGLAGLSAHPHSRSHAQSLVAHHHLQHSLHSPPTSSSSLTPVSPAGTGALHPIPSASPSAPRPIFPAEDRETIARSSHIAFGSFPEMLPLPSYAHYHASGGSAAYLAGAGGWGSVPYGVVPTSTKRVTPSEGGGPCARGTARRSTREADAEEDEAEADAEVDVLELDEERDRGRSGESAGDEAARSASATQRLRGRSAPHIRKGPDGRETLLIGDIEVVLPRPEDVEDAEHEDEKDRGDLVEEDASEEVDGERGPGSEGSCASSHAEGQLDVSPVDEVVDDPAPPVGADDILERPVSPCRASSSSPSPPPSSAQHATLPTWTTQPPTPAKPSRPLRHQLSDLGVDVDHEPHDRSPAIGCASVSPTLSS
ncbi:hypothetical protein JCM8208_002799 [Rhodotorula glutinis]